MAIRFRTIETARPDLRAARSVIERPVSTMKETYLITRVEVGRSEFWTNGKTWRVGPGAIVLNQPGNVRREISQDGPLTIQSLNVPAPLVAGMRMQAVLEAGDPRAVPFHRLHDAIAARADRLALDVTLAEALGAMAGLPDVRDTYSRAVRRALELAHDRVAEPITLEELAVHAGLDKFHLCRAFRAQVGMPPHAYLTHLRILRAKALLGAGVRPKDVAPRVGLYDQSQLNRHFRRIVGTTPGEYARAIHSPWIQV